MCTRVCAKKREGGGGARHGVGDERRGRQWLDPSVSAVQRVSRESERERERARDLETLPHST